MATVTVSGRSYDVEVRGDTVVVDGHEFPITVRNEKGMALVNSGGVNYRVQLPPEGQRDTGMSVEVDYRPYTIEFDGRFGGAAAPTRAQRTSSAAAPAPVSAATKGAVSAQIAGRVLSVRVKVGDQVARGDVLLILEAMKMENEIKAGADGTVKEILVADGSRVAEGQALVIVE